MKEGFSLSVNIQEWAKKDDSSEDWKFPLKFVKGADARVKAGTTIKVTDFPEAIKMVFSD